MKQIDICHFSGTGNTLRILMVLVRAFEDRGINVRLHPMEHTDPKTLDVPDTLGLVFPVAFQSTYPFVWKFIRSLPKNPGKDGFMVDTLAGYSGGIVGVLRDTMRRKGYRTVGAVEIIMPDNLFQRKDHPQENRACIESGEQKARAFASALIQKEARWEKKGMWSYGMFTLYLMVIFFLLPPWQWLLRPLFLHVRNDRCIRCGLCVQLCPIQNILPSGHVKLPQFRYHCQGCMRCIAYCPKNAIYAGLRRKAAWHYRGLEAKEMIESYNRGKSSQTHGITPRDPST